MRTPPLSPLLASIHLTSHSAPHPPSFRNPPPAWPASWRGTETDRMSQPAVGKGYRVIWQSGWSMAPSPLPSLTCSVQSGWCREASASSPCSWSAWSCEEGEGRGGGKGDIMRRAGRREEKRGGVWAAACEGPREWAQRKNRQGVGRGKGGRTDCGLEVPSVPRKYALLGDPPPPPPDRLPSYDRSLPSPKTTRPSSDGPLTSPPSVPPPPPSTPCPPALQVSAPLAAAAQTPRSHRRRRHHWHSGTSRSHGSWPVQGTGTEGRESGGRQFTLIQRVGWAVHTDPAGGKFTLIQRVDSSH